MVRQIAFFLIALLILTDLLKAQQYYFRHYQVEQGLSNNTVFCCAQDKRGFFWLGTKDGLNRFDGHSFKVFRSDAEDSTSIGDNFIRSLYISDSNILYAGTRNGLYRYNERKESFSVVYASSEEIKDIKKDADGHLWFIAGQTLIRLNEQDKRSRKFQPADYFPATSVSVDIDGVVWASSSDGQLNRYEARSDTFSAFSLFAEGRSYSSPKWIEKIYATPDHNILVATSNYGAKRFDTRTNQCYDILTYNEDKTGIFARDFVQTSPDEYWIATESGIFIYNKVSGQSVNLKKQYGNPYSVSDNAVYSLCRDKEGGIWAGTYFGGMNYFPRQYTGFEKFYPGSGKHSLSGNAVREICEDDYGNIWVGTEDAGLNRFDKRTGQFQQYKPSGASRDISYSNVHGLLANGKELWIGTFEHGLDIMDIETGKVIRHYPSKKHAATFRSNFIVVLYKAKNGDVFTGTRQGLYRFNKQADDFDPIPQVPPDCFVHTILEDSEGTIWVGTLGNGLYYYNPVKGASGHFNYRGSNKKGLPGNSVTTLFESADKTLWIGTEGAGLARFNKTDSSFFVYSTKNGLPSNTIFRIMEDDRHRLWITSSHGLVSFDVSPDKMQVYTTSNGLLSNQFNYNSGYKDENGVIYLGSARGLIRFNPASFFKSDFNAPVYFTGFFINDQELLVNNNNSPLHESIAFSRGIELSHTQSSFSIDFAALSYTAPETIEYKYMMEGLDNKWTYLKTNRKVYFTDLSPGTYRFKVIAGSGGGIWSEDISELQIKILPPFWATRLAYVIYTALAISLAYLLFRNYHNRLADKTRRKIEFLEHEKEKEIYSAKINFFTNIAHEIKTPLTLIKAPMERIIEKAGDNSELSGNLRIMERNTQRLVELTNQLLNFRRMEMNVLPPTFILTNLNELMQERFASFKPLADRENKEMTIDMPDNPVIAEINPDGFQKIVNNLFYNAINYSFGTVNIRIEPNRIAHNICIKFSNDGHIIQPAMKEKIFQPFFRLKETQDKPGTGIGLALAKSLAEMHHGRLYLADPENNLNVFILEIPVRQTTDRSPNITN